MKEERAKKEKFYQKVENGLKFTWLLGCHLN